MSCPGEAIVSWCAAISKRQSGGGGVRPLQVQVSTCDCKSPAGCANMKDAQLLQSCRVHVHFRTCWPAVQQMPSQALKAIVVHLPWLQFDYQVCRRDQGYGLRAIRAHLQCRWPTFVVTCNCSNFACINCASLLMCCQHLARIILHLECLLACSFSCACCSCWQMMMHALPLCRRVHPPA